jgi:hypothetical protein
MQPGRAGMRGGVQVEEQRAGSSGVAARRRGWWRRPAHKQGQALLATLDTVLTGQPL